MSEAGRQSLIAYLGLSPSSIGEAQQLRGQGNQVLLISDGKVPDHVRVGTKLYDLADPNGRLEFTSTLGISASRATSVAAAIAGAGRNVKDELAQLATLWARAERTNILPGRMVISGEHVIGIFWGKHGNGMLVSDNIQALAAAFPRAAAAVEDLLLSACNTAADVKDWPKIFPKLQTIWAYLHTAPSLATGLRHHLRMWDRATRGHAQRIDRLVAKDTGRGENVAVWSRIYGLQTGIVESADVLRARIAAAESLYQAFFLGDQVVADHQSGPLRQYYDDLQSLMRHDDIPASEKKTLAERAEITIRVIYFDKVREGFQRQYQAAIKAGYAAVGMAARDFSAMDRKQALSAVAEFETHVGPDASPAARTLRSMLVEGLRALESRYTPLNWI